MATVKPLATACTQTGPTRGNPAQSPYRTIRVPQPEMLLQPRNRSISGYRSATSLAEIHRCPSRLVRR
jgi:hypothetical protein